MRKLCHRPSSWQALAQPCQIGLALPVSPAAAMIAMPAFSSALAASAVRSSSMSGCQTQRLRRSNIFYQTEQLFNELPSFSSGIGLAEQGDACFPLVSLEAVTELR